MELLSNKKKFSSNSNAEENLILVVTLLLKIKYGLEMSFSFKCMMKFSILKLLKNNWLPVILNLLNQKLVEIQNFHSPELY
jgi:hypothetical protein